MIRYSDANYLPTINYELKLRRNLCFIFLESQKKEKKFSFRIGSTKNRNELQVVKTYSVKSCLLSVKDKDTKFICSILNVMSINVEISKQY